MSLSRLFCFSGGGVRGDGDWQSAHLGSLATASARARVLEVLEEELEARFAAAGPLPPGAAAAAARASADAPHVMRRLYQANLPASELGRCRELLRKLAAIDAAREAAAEEQQQLAAQVKAAEAAHRQAEFARARAEAIATARGEALMHAQQATREAELQSMQLGEMLQQALGQLGIEITPFKAGQQQALLTPPPAGGPSTTPQAVRQSIFSDKQLAAVAASLSKLPRQSQQWRQAAEGDEPAGQALRQVMEEEEAEQENRNRQQPQHRHRASQKERQEREADAQRQQRRNSRRGSHQGGVEARPAEQRQRAQAEEEGEAHSDRQQLSGFTVYTNGLQSEEFGGEGPDAGEVAQRPPSQRSSQQQVRRSSASAGGGQDSQGSGVQWRSISSAAISSRSQEEDPREQQQAQQGRRSQQGSLAGSRGSSRQDQARQLRGSVGSLEQAAGAEWEQRQQEEALQHQARQLRALVVPGVDASQMDSLVRIGASQQSPDPHRPPRSSADASQQLPSGWEAAAGARQWDSGINPLQSDAEAQQVLQGLRREWQHQGGAGAGSAAGSRRASRDGHGGMAHSVAVVPTERQQATASRQQRGPRAGSEPPGLLQVPEFDGKVPGAGTWVSPSLAAMLAHKKGYNPLLDGGEPSPPSHIKAVFGTSQDKEFYGPMAAHLNKREAPAPAPVPAAPGRPPMGASAESIRGPARSQPPSNRSSMDGGSGGAAEWERRTQQFQPMGQYAAAQAAPRRSSVAVSQLGRSAEHEGMAAALGRASVRGSGLPPRHGAAHQQQRQAQQSAAQPPTKRSLDSMRASLGGAGGPGADSIAASLLHVEAAMAALRDANPHLSQQHAAVAPAQQAQAPAAPTQPGQQYGRASESRRPVAPAGAPLAGPHHARTRSLPENTLEDLPLHELTNEEHRRWREQQRLSAAAQARPVYHRA